MCRVGARPYAARGGIGRLTRAADSGTLTTRIVKELPHGHAECALKVISGRWKVVILFYLLDGRHRLSELKRRAPDASQKMLVQQLRELEEHGIVRREVFAEVPPRVEYSLTKLGASLPPIVGALCEWEPLHTSELARIERTAQRAQ
jgi:DNA-binding HxlR family transcriptional regulator